MRTPISHVELRWRVVGSTEAWNSTQLSAGETRFHLPNAITGVAYTVQARFVTEGGAVSEWGNTIQVVDGVVSLDKPTIGIPVAVADGISVAWTTAGTLPVDTEYLLQHAIASSGPWTDVARIRSTRFTDPVVDGASYWYRVCAINFNGDVSAWSTTAGATTAKTVANGADVSTNNTPVPVLNAFFEAGNVHWTTQGIGWAIVQGAGMNSSYYIARKNSGDSAAQLINNGKMPVSVGQDVTARVYFQGNAGTTGAIQVGVHWYKADGSYLSTSWATAKPVSTTWTDSTVQLIAPALSAFSVLVVGVSGHTAGEWRVDNASMAPAKLDAGTDLGDLTNQNILTISEKPPVISEYNAITSEYTSIYNAGTTWNNLTERNAFATAKTSLDNHLALQSAPVLWNNTTDKTSLVLGTTGQSTGMLALRYVFSQYYTARQTLLDKNAYAARAAVLTQMPWKQTFQDFNVADWVFVSGDASRLTVVDGGSAGGKILRADGAAWIEFKYNIPYDPARTYRVKVRVRKPSGGAYTFFAGLAGVAADGITMVNKTGLNDRTSQHYGPSSVTPPTSWVVGGAGEYTFYWKGTTATGTDGSANCLAPGSMHDSVRYVNPLLILNYGAPAGQNNIMEVDILEFVDAADDVAAAKASSAVQLSASKTKVFYKTSAPTNADASPDVLRNGDLWFDTTLWAQADVDAGKCGAPDVGTKKNIVHKYDSTASAEPIPYWPITQSTKQVVFGEVAAQSIGVDELDANRLVVNYLEEDGTRGSGFPVGTPLRGVKLFDATTPVKIGPGGAVVGPYLLDASVVRSLSVLGQSSDNLRVWYRGNMSGVQSGFPVLMDTPWAPNAYYAVGARCLSNDGIYRCTTAGTTNGTAISGTGSAISCGTTVWAYVGTMANNERLQIHSQAGCTLVGGNLAYYSINFRIQPRDVNDNLDVIDRIWCDIYDNVGSWRQNLIVTVPGRSYRDKTTDNAIANCSEARAHWLAPVATNYASTYPDLYIKANVHGVNGISERHYRLLNGGYGTFATGGVTIPGVVAPPPPPADGGDTGGTCPAPETLILMADGSWKAAGSIVVGDIVHTKHETTGEWGDFPVTYAETFQSERLRLTLHDGRTLVASPDHRVYAHGDWRNVKCLTVLHMVEGTSPGSVVSNEPAEYGPVVKLTIDDAHTYVTEGLLSHNMKKL